jgi:FkbM family methyltransferase
MTLRDVDPQYLSNLPYYGRHVQDKFLHEKIFGDLQHGFFIDLGAYDGVESSNTLFFEESLGWSGICVEPLPHIFLKLLANRKAACINKCALDRYGKAQFLHVIPQKQPTPPIGERRSNVEKLSGLVECSTEQHQKMMKKMVKDVGGSIGFFEAECVPINDILAGAPQKIDLLSIDTEGSEFRILQAIDFTQFKIDVIVVEDLFSDRELLRFMKANNYSYVATVGYDSIYKKRS